MSEENVRLFSEIIELIISISQEKPIGHLLDQKINLNTRNGLIRQIKIKKALEQELFYDLWDHFQSAAGGDMS